MDDMEKKLIEVTGVKPKAKEKRQAFLERLIEGAEKLEDDQWDKLPEPAQKWVNAGIKNLKAEKDVADFKGAAADEGDDEKTETKPKATAKPTKPKGKDEDDKGGRVPNIGGVKGKIKALLIKDPALSADEIVKKIGKGGPSKLTAASIRSEFRHSLYCLKEAGCLKGISLD